ncbi:Hypothetical protein NCS54_00911700 [Fusarium falciforme]|uniref:Hypothetical protein n=1 Tax=Fusarium falciforme TaxID=195108 RepID=UPI002300708B|nr:Hypothetical protein NCS54_00911700 [Fusarium falciforme]WAO91637.1 Hypothetical protein NCS54_00911700 [Fusarium falciforme]
MAWQSLYWSMMSTGLFYMKHQSCVELGVQDKTTLTETCYRRALDALASSDFMAYTPSKPSAYSFHAHMLSVIQDSYLTTFKGTYNIVPAHAKTPLPVNCSEVMEEFQEAGKVQVLPLSIPTQTTYMILQVHLTSIKQRLHEDTYEAAGKRINVAERYQKVLQTDEDLAILRQQLPPWMKTKACPEDAAPFVRHQWRTFRISYAHMKLSIHRAFFCHSFTMKQFSYSHQACLDAARMLLLTYRDTAQASEFDSWTVPAHVISASLIITLDIVLRDNGDDFDPNVARSLADDKGLMLECLELVEATQSSLLVKRGLTLVSKLIADRERRSPTYSRFDGPEISKLVQEVEDALATEEAPPTAYNVTFEEYLDMMGNDLFAFMDDESCLLD